MLRLATSIPAMAMPISRWERRCRRPCAPARVQARATASCPALTAATRSMTAAKMSRIQAGMLMPISLRGVRQPASGRPRHGGRRERPVGQGQQGEQRAGVGVGAAAGQDGAERLPDHPDDRGHHDGQDQRGPGRRAAAGRPRRAMTTSATASTIEAASPLVGDQRGGVLVQRGQPAGLPAAPCRRSCRAAPAGPGWPGSARSRPGCPTSTSHRPRATVAPTARAATNGAGAPEAVIRSAGHSSTASSA